MRLIDFIQGLAKYSPDLGVRSKSASAIGLLFTGASETKYVSCSLLLAFLCSVASLLFLPLIFIPIVFSLVAYLLLSLPKFELRKIADEIELELPFFLRELGILLEMGVRFKDGLRIASENKGQLQKQFGMVLSEMESGASFPQALADLLRNSPSQQFRRAASSLLVAYESGDVKGLGPISDELLLIQKHQIKESSSRFSLFGILFIVFSALAPTFFLVYFALGGSLLSQSIPESLFVAGMLVLFPALSILVLMVAKSSSGPKESAPAFVLNPIRFFQEQSRKEEMEKLLPDALIALAATPAGSSTESTFASLAKGGYGPLSEEFKISFKQLRSKISLEKVLVDMAKRNPSILVKRACYLLNYIFSTNHLASAARLAEDLLIQLELKRERAAALAIHKYTLFFGAILVPTILSLSISICGQLSQFTGGSNTVLIYPVIYAYLFVYAAMVSYFAADSEGKPSLLVVYFPLLFAVSLITFNTVKLF